MKGLELSRRFYEAYGAEALKEAVPELAGRIAAGLAGEGSECFGYDDEVSRDHDWGPAFCIWLSETDYLLYAQKLRKVYESLPREFEGFRAAIETPQRSTRIGVQCTQAWYRRLIGTPGAPRSLKQWNAVPEVRLAAAVNGQVFEDPLGEFTSIRNALLSYYPEDVRRRKIAERCAVIAQAGQYNYPRSVKRGDAVAAMLSLDLFVRAGISLVYLLNRRYAPFYKWQYRGLADLKILPRTYKLFGKLAAAPETADLQETAAVQSDLIERICYLTEAEFERQGLSFGKGRFMQEHCSALIGGIRDKEFREIPLRIDEW